MALTQISTQGIKDGTITGTDLATNIDLVDNQKIRFGDSPDLEIYHSGTASFISDVGGGVLKLTTDGLRVRNALDNQNMIKADQNDAVELYHNNALRLKTESYGISITGSLISSGTLQSNGGNIQLLSDSQKIFAGAGQDLGIFHDGTNSFIENTTGNLHIRPKAAEEGIKIIPDGAVELYFNNVKKVETSADGLDLPDNSKLQLGDSQDLQIFHDGTQSIIKDSGTGQLRISGQNTVAITNAAATENYARFLNNGAVELYHDNVKKIETTSSGITVQGSVTTQDMNMSNLNGIANEVDNTKGSWSIQEGADDLFLINRVSGKKYKFNLTEVS